MSKERIQILVVDDEPSHAEAIRRSLEGAAATYEISAVGSLQEYARAIAKSAPNLVLLDLMLPDGRAESVLAYPPEAGSFPVVVMTSHGDEQVAAAAMRSGALDYVVKSPDAFANLPHTIDRALRGWELLMRHKDAQDQLRQSELRYRALFNESVEGIYLHDLDGRIVDANRMAVAQSGYSREELLRLTVFDLHPAPSPREAMRAKWKGWAVGERHTFELEHRRRDGTAYPAGVSTGKVRHGDQELMLAIVRDITERKQAEDEIRKQAGLIESLLDSIPDMIFYKDLNGVYLGCNPAFAEFAGRPEEEIVGKTDHDLFDHEVAGFFREQDRIMLTSLQARQNAEWVTYPDGRRLLLDTLKTPYWGPDKKLVGVLGISRNITAQKQAEEALAAEAIRRRILIEGSTDGIVVLDQNGKVFEANPKYAQMLGYTMEEVRQLHVWDWDTQWKEEQLLGMIRDLGEAGDHIETRHRRKDGSYYDVDISSSAAVLGGQKLVFCVCRDISDRKRAEEALRRNEERFRGTLENMLEGCQMIGFDWRYLYLNETAAAQGRSTVEALLGRTMMDAYPGIEKTAGFAHLQRCMTERVAARVENEFTFPDGAKGWFQLLIQPSSDGIFVMSLDITERRLAENQLRQLSRAVEQSPSSIVITDTQGAIEYVNPKFTQTTGYTLEEARGQNPRVLKSGEMSPLVYQHLWAAISQGQEWRGELHNRKKNGELYWESACISPITDAAGRVTHFVAIKDDVTERKRVEEALRHSEERYRGLVETTFDWIWEIDAEGRYTYASPKVTELLGYAPDEVLGRTPFDFMPENEAQRVRVFFQRLTTERAPFSSLLNLNRHKDGRLVILESSGVPVIGPKGDLQGYRGMDRDITERHQAEHLSRLQHRLAQALAASSSLKEGLRLCLDAAMQAANLDSGSFYLWDEAADAFVLQNYQGVSEAFALASQRLEAGSAFARTLMLGKPHYGLLPNLTESLTEVQRKEGLRFIAAFPLQHDGRIFGALTLASHEIEDIPPMLREVLETIAAGAAHAIARLKAEEALRSSEQRFRTLVDSAPDGILVHANGNIVYVNRAATELFGAGTTQQLLGHPAWERFHPDAKPPVCERIRSLMEDRRPIALTELRCVRLDGKAFEAEFSAVPFSYDGQPAALMFFSDATRRKELEGRLRQSQKLEAIGQLAGGVAHDFNNILAAMMMHLGLLQMNPALDEETTRVLKDLEEEAGRAAGLTRQLLMFSRRSVLAMRPLEINEVVANLLKMLGRLIGEHIDLRFDGKSSLPLVEADAGMLDQVLMNLVVNARDAMPNGGRITISTSLAVVEAEQVGGSPDRREGRFVCLTVSDTGSGMDSPTLKRIFDPFFTTKEPGKGTGLGLATVHGIVAQHRGWVEVESLVMHGSTFRIYLPEVTHAQVAPADVAVTPSPLKRGKETILVVEDDPHVRRLTAQSLRVLGYRVYEAANGQEAMTMWLSQGATVDLLLTDMVMPEGMTGLELTERLQTLKPGLKVIIASGYSDEIVRAGVPTKSGVVYLPKPYQAKVLAEVVRDCLDRRT